MNLKLHLMWSVVAVVSAAAWGRVVVRSGEADFHEREKLLRVKVVQATAAAAAARVQPRHLDPTTLVATPVATLTTPEKPAAEYELQAQDLPSVEELRKLMQNGNDVWRAYQVIQRMVECPLKTQLLRELFVSKDPQVRRSVMYMLQEALGPEASAPLFQECLRSDPSADVRELAAQMLGSLDAPGTLQALLQAFQKDELHVQITCASALIDLGHLGPAAQLVPRFGAMLDSPDGALRRQAVESLGRLSCPESLALLTRALRDTNGDVRLEALNGLWNLDDAQIIALVEPLLNDPVSSVRESAKSMVEQAKSSKE